MVDPCKMLAVVILALCLPSVAVQDACSIGLCKCAHRVARCSNTNLTYIPKFPDNTIAVYFKYNYLPRVTPTTVLNISNTRISTVNLHHNEIENIDEFVFQNLSHVYLLDLTDNLLTSDSLRNLFSSFQRNSNLSKISLRGNRLEYIPHNVFVDFKSAENITLNLSQNRIKLLNMTVFNEIEKLQILDVSNNKISTVIPGVSHHLQHLSISNNSLTVLPNFCLRRNSFPELTTLQLQSNKIGNFVPKYFNCLEKLKHLSISNNSLAALPNFCYRRNLFPEIMKLQLQRNIIGTFVPEHLNCLEKLQILDVSSNYIDSLKTDYFHSFKSLSSLSISEQGRTFYIEERAFNNSKLLSLDLSKNTLTTNRLHEHAFCGLDRLLKLDLSKSNFFKMEEKLNKTLAPLTSLEVLMLLDCNLQNLPTVTRHYHNLTYLDVGWNLIKSWPTEFFERNIKLTELNAAHNLIQTVTSKMLPEVFMTRLKKISLNDNPLVCKCELVWLIQWIHKEPSKFWDYPDGYRCLNITERISVINKYIWHIKYHIYMWRYRPKQLLDIAEKHFAHDAFVAYCIEDGDWVLHDLLPIVEEGENIKLCIHERDFLGGQLIIDNIVQHMEDSRKVLVILSNDFARSKWCQFEMSLAQKLVIDTSIESIVVVLLEDIEAVNMSKPLNALLKTTTYIKWQDNDNKDIFWQMLKTSLKRQYEL
ncbi:toll-like receptor 4 [Patella vulgata]|uniref:toll-like receptor 4 n=1 Tax=Patella vulgata TaxID=6465 RepID=UPI0024A90CE4|nr:toll-like receptor 4 [Patella vulgata]